MLHRHARPAVAGSFMIGTIAGAFATAAVLAIAAGLLSPIPASARATAALLVLALLWLHTLGVLCLDLPQNRRQIPQSAFHDRPTRAAWRFGAELGTGLRTYLPDPSPHALAVVLLLTPGAGFGALAAAAAAGLGFGIGRGLVVVLHSQQSSVAVEHPARWLRLGGLVAMATITALAIRPLI